MTSVTGIWNSLSKRVRTSPPGSTSPARLSGFTLIEVMVVVLIIGIIINFAVISVGRNNPADAVRNEARRFSSLIELSLEEALLRNELIGILVEEDGYEFLLRVEKSWEPLQQTLFRKRELPENLHLKLVTESTTDEEKDPEERIPDIILFSTGEMTPFEIKVSSDITEEFSRISGSETGKLSLDHVSP